MTNGQSSRVIAASGTDRRIRLRRPAPAGTPPTAPGRQAPAAADRPRPQQTNPGTQQGSTPAKNAACRTGLLLRRSAVAGACHCSNQPPPPSIVTQACHYSNRTSPKPVVAQAEPHPVLPPNPIAAPPAATQSDHCPGLPPLDRSPHKKTPRPRRDAAYRDTDTGSPTPTRSLRAVWRRCRRLRG